MINYLKVRTARYVAVMIFVVQNFKYQHITLLKWTCGTTINNSLNEVPAIFCWKWASRSAEHSLAIWMLVVNWIALKMFEKVKSRGGLRFIIYPKRNFMNGVLSIASIHLLHKFPSTISHPSWAVALDKKNVLNRTECLLTYSNAWQQCETLRFYLNSYLNGAMVLAGCMKGSK